MHIITRYNVSAHSIHLKFCGAIEIGVLRLGVQIRGLEHILPDSFPLH